MNKQFLIETLENYIVDKVTNLNHQETYFSYIKENVRNVVEIIHKIKNDDIPEPIKWGGDILEWYQYQIIINLYGDKYWEDKLSGWPLTEGYIILYEDELRELIEQAEEDEYLNNGFRGVE